MIEPPPFFFIARTAYLVVKKTPLTSTTRCRTDGINSSHRRLIRVDY